MTKKDATSERLRAAVTRALTVQLLPDRPLRPHPDQVSAALGMMRALRRRMHRRCCGCIPREAAVPLLGRE